MQKLWPVLYSEGHIYILFCYLRDPLPSCYRHLKHANDTFQHAKTMIIPISIITKNKYGHIY